MASRKTLSSFNVGNGNNVQGVRRTRNRDSSTRSQIARREEFTVESILDEFVDRDKITSDQKSTLVDSRYSNGDNFYSVNTLAEVRFDDIRDTLEGVSNLIETISILKSGTFEKLNDQVEKSIDTGSILSVNTSTFENLKEKVKEEQDIEMIVEGRDDIGECLACGCKILILRSMQTSRGDESTSIIYNCASCKAGRSRLRIY